MSRGRIRQYLAVIQMSARELNDWIEGYLKFAENTEPPISYHIWTAIGTIAAALERKVYCRWGLDTIYPNQYIVLVGPAGATRKSVALGIGHGFLKDLEIPLGSQKQSKEAFYKALNESITNFTDSDDGKIKHQSALTMVSSELIVFMGTRDTDFLASLTDLYDCGDPKTGEWTYETKWSGVDRIMGVCFNLIGATAPEWFGAMLSPEAFGGGWTSRTMFIVEYQKAKVVDDPNAIPIDEELRARLQRDLERIHLLTGEMRIDQSARDKYSPWYLRQEAGIARGKWPVDDPRFAAYTSRRATHIKKVAMALSASRGDDLAITGEDFDRARLILEKAEKKMPKAFGGFGRSRFSETTEIIEDYIRHRGTITRSQVLRRYSNEVSAWDLEQIEEILRQMKRIEVVIDTETNDREYTYIGD